MLLESILTLSQPTPEFIERKKNSTEIVAELQTNRNEYRLAQAIKESTSNKRTQTIEIPDGYILCPKDYVCIPKNIYNGQPVVPSTVNQVPQATITNPNPNQQPSQNINQNINSGSSTYTGQSTNTGYTGSTTNGTSSTYYGSGTSQTGKINTSINLGINVGVSW
jgi:hypothetical protein